MTIREIEHVRYVTEFIGVPYKWNSFDIDEGLDCRTLVVCYLQGLGYDIDGDDGIAIPREDELVKIIGDRDSIKGLADRYIQGVREKGAEVSPEDIMRNDIVMYKTKELPHIGVYVGNGKMIVAAQRHKSLLVKLCSVKDAIITVVRVRRR